MVISLVNDHRAGDDGVVRVDSESYQTSMVISLVADHRAGGGGVLRVDSESYQTSLVISLVNGHSRRPISFSLKTRKTRKRGFDWFSCATGSALSA